jgi:four helix bundle protein
MSNSNPKREYDLENRLIRFSGMVNALIISINKTKETRNICDQLTRSSESSALNYGEAQVAESMSDFIHKISIVLKELKETRVAIKLLKIRNICKEQELLEKCDNECSELVAIFITSVRTARNSLAKKTGM